jgi:hypothetical protein
MRRRQALAALSAVVPLSGCFTFIPVRSPSDSERGHLEFRSTDGQTGTASVVVTNGEQTLADETVQFGDPDETGRVAVSFSFPDEADCDVRVRFDREVTELDRGERVQGDWKLDHGVVVGTVSTLSCDKTYEFSVRGGAVTLSLEANCV